MSPTSGSVITESDSGKLVDTLNGDNDYKSITDSNNKGKNAEEIASMVFSLVSAARDFAEGMDDGDEIKLLRLRTRKNEVVIVPGQLLLNNRMSKHRSERKSTLTLFTRYKVPPCCYSRRALLTCCLRRAQWAASLNAAQTFAQGVLSSESVDFLVRLPSCFQSNCNIPYGSRNHALTATAMS